MVASKTVGDWFYWLFLYFVACVPAALFGGDMAGSFVYVHDHHHRITNYMQVLNIWEWIAAVICAAPGFVWVGVCQLRDYREVQARLRKTERAESNDASVWPPAPKA